MNQSNIDAIADLVITYAPIHAHYLKYHKERDEIKRWTGAERAERYLIPFEAFEKIYQECLFEKNPLYQLILCKLVTNFIKTNNNISDQELLRQSLNQSVLATFTSLNSGPNTASDYIVQLDKSIKQCALSLPMLEKIYLEEVMRKSPDTLPSLINKV